MRCIVCGKSCKEWSIKPVITDELARAWRLTNRLRKQFDLRESSLCPHCGCSFRSRALAQAIMAELPFNSVDIFSNWVKKANRTNLRVVEINACGQLHESLKKIKNLKYSEYGKGANNFWRLLLGGPRSEDITALSYKDNSFDLVLHSEVLEHVEDVNKALAECRRILKSSGRCLFTVPVIMERKTKQCAWFDPKTGKIRYLEKPSYHGSGKKDDFLVFWEFGGDIVGKYGLEVVYRDKSRQMCVMMLKK